MKALKESFAKDEIPYTVFQVDDVQEDYERMKNLGVQSTMETTNIGVWASAIFNDTCGNLIEIFQINA